MGKQSRAKRERRAGVIDRHLPNATAPVHLWGYDEAAHRVHAIGAASFWRELPGRRVACELCYRRCEIAPGEAGWCTIRRNDGGKLRIPEHGVIAAAYQHETPLHLHAYAGLSVVYLAGTSCTAGCSFCSSTYIARHPDWLPWVDDTPYAPARSGGGAYVRAMMHPSDAIDFAHRWSAEGVQLGGNEPLLTYEWSFDVARLAKSAGLMVLMESNGFATPEAIDAIAPFVDSVHLGIKGHLEPEWYAKRMRSPGATPHVQAAAVAWRRHPNVALGISDLVPPPHWMSDAEAESAIARLASWIAAELGEMTPLALFAMYRPTVADYEEGRELLLPRDATAADREHYLDRLARAEEIARAQGLRYVARIADGTRGFDCHACGAELIADISGEYRLHITEGRCTHCGAEVPIRALTRKQHAATLARRYEREADDQPIRRRDPVRSAFLGI